MSAPMPPRDPPYNPDAEMALLGALLGNNRLLEYAEILQPDHFGNALHARIFEQVRKLIARGQVANPITLKAIFDQDPALEDRGGARYLAKLAEAGRYCLHRVEVEQHADAVYDCWLRRELIALHEESAAAAWRIDPNDPPPEQIERAEAGLHRLAESGRPGAGLRSWTVAIEKALASGEAAYQRGDEIVGVPTGFADLDKRLGGLHRSNLVVLAARTAMGKTSLAENISRNAAKAGKVVVFFSLEMSEEELGARVLAAEARVPSDWTRHPANFAQHVAKFVDAKQRLCRLQVHIDDEPALSVAAVHARARRHKRQHGLDLIVVDYLQLVRAARLEGRREQNRVQEVGEISSGLKRMAKDLEVPVLALSQLSRAVEAREDKRPLLADLRESGSIEQDADIVMFLFREEYYEPDKEAVHNKAELIVAKNRHGPCCTVQLHFDKVTTQFSDLARGFEER